MYKTPSLLDSVKDNCLDIIDSRGQQRPGNVASHASTSGLGPRPSISTDGVPLASSSSKPGKSPRFENPMCKTTENIGRSKYRRENNRKQSGRDGGIRSRFRGILFDRFLMCIKLRFRCVSKIVRNRFILPNVRKETGPPIVGNPHQGQVHIRRAKESYPKRSRRILETSSPPIFPVHYRFLLSYSLAHSFILSLSGWQREIR